MGLYRPHVFLPWGGHACYPAFKLNSTVCARYPHNRLCSAKRLAAWCSQRGRVCSGTRRMQLGAAERFIISKTKNHAKQTIINRYSWRVSLMLVVHAFNSSKGCQSLYISFFSSWQPKMEGHSQHLWLSIHKLSLLSKHFRLQVCQDYKVKE